MEEMFIGAARYDPRGRTKEDTFKGVAIHINPEVKPWRIHL
jgi:hypothetical protein